MTIIDSSSWIESLRDRGDPEVRARVASLLESGEAAWCPIIRLELWRGVQSSAERRALEFLNGRITMLDIDAQVWGAAYHLMLKSRAAGLTAPVADVLIVATAQHHATDLEHCDRHLDRLLKLA